MALSQPPSNGSESGSNLQRVAIGAGTLIVVVLTVIIAIFLTLRELQPPETPTPSPTTIVLAPTFTATPLAPATETPVITSTPLPPPTTAPPEPATATPTATATNTPLPPPPTLPPTQPPAVVPSPTAPPAAVTTPPPPGPCQPRQGWVTYVAQAGDTYFSLAERTNTSVADLAEVNCPEDYTLRVGQIIYLPFTPPTPTPTFTPTPTRPPPATPTRTPTPISPEIDSVSPRQVNEDYTEFVLTVLGRNFRVRERGFRVELRGPQSVTLPLREPSISDTSFDAIVPAGLASGTYDLVVMNPDNRSGVRAAALTIGPVTPTPIVPGPDITDVDPASGFNDVDNIVEVRGRNFRPTEPGFRVELRLGSRVEAVLNVVGAASASAFNVRILAGLPANTYDLWVINPDAQEDVEPLAYESRNR